ncbi:MAG: substrate-binding domain-containing protein [Prevotella sp.]|nr:substrate-binding domain-containing protein [Bacteroides sp.]MCM1366692.1 substrate-binding domain-containing protein [Prevotella sp.]
MNKNIAGIFVVTLLIAFGIIACTPVKRGEYAKGSGTIFCDDGFKNIMQEEIEVFEFSYPDASIIPFYVSEKEAVDSLMADVTQQIVISRELTKEEIAYCKKKNKRIVRQNCIAVDAVALIVNKNNPVGALSLEDIKGIMTGRITSWDQLAGNDTTAIKIVFDNAGSSTVSYMRQRFLDNKGSISDHTNSFAQKNNAQVFDVVKRDPNALGIISVSWLGDDLSGAKKVPLNQRVEDYKNETDTIATNLTTEVNIIKISNPIKENDFSPVSYAPYQAYIYSGEYPLVRKIFMISTASNSTVMHSFYTFVTGYVGQKIISRTGILPYHVNPRVVNLIDNKNK